MKRLALVGLYLALVSCAERQNSLPQLGGQVPAATIQQMDFAEPGKLIVVDESNTPVPNAAVLIGHAPGDPFEGNALKTDASGQIKMPANFKSELPMTVQAEGYITQTYWRFSPNTTIARMNKKESATRVEVKGNTSNYQGLIDGDNKIDFSLMIPSLNKMQLLAFDLSTVLSPENDTVRIAGKDVPLPSNIALPEQHEKYKIIIPVDLDKPGYRAITRSSGANVYNGIRGWFPMTKVVDDIRAGKSVFDMINHFNFTSMGRRDVTATSDVSGQDIDVGQIALDADFTVRSPAFDNSKVMLALGFGEENGRYAVTDLKRLTGNQTVALKGTSKIPSHKVMAALMQNNQRFAPEPMDADQLISIRHLEGDFSLNPHLASTIPDFRQLSFTFQNEGEGAPNFMPLVAAPTIDKNVVQLQVPALPAGLRVVGTYLVYVDIVPGAAGKVKSDIRTRLWEIWNDGWMNTVTLPEVTFAKTPGHTYRWEVMFLATSKSAFETATDGSALDIESITHVTRNALNVEH